MRFLVKAGRTIYILLSNILLDVFKLKAGYAGFTHNWLLLNYKWINAHRALGPGKVIASNNLNAVDFFSLFPEARGLTVPMDTQYAEWNMPPTELYYLNCIALVTNAKRIFEFGTYNGATSYQLAKACPDSQIFTIDIPPYTSDFVIGSRYRGTPQESQITQLIHDSKTFDYAEFLGTIDFVFVDADHEYEGVHSDTLNALKLVRPGGVIVWDDYTHIWPGVMRALEELAQEYPVVRIEGTKLAVLKVEDGG